MQIARSGSAACVLDGLIYIIGNPNPNLTAYKLQSNFNSLNTDVLCTMAHSLFFKSLRNSSESKKTDTPQPLYNTIVGVHSINRVS